MTPPLDIEVFAVRFWGRVVWGHVVDFGMSQVREQP